MDYKSINFKDKPLSIDMFPQEISRRRQGAHAPYPCLNYALQIHLFLQIVLAQYYNIPMHCSHVEI